MIAEAAPRFQLFGPLHLGILLATVLIPIALSWCARTWHREHAISWALVVTLVVNWLVVLARYAPVRPWPDLLPMHLCDWATFTIAVALLRRGQIWYELAYFWGLSGTLQAVITPDLPEVDAVRVWTFFIGHSGIIAGVLFATWGLKMRPQFPGSLLRAFAWLQFYAVCAGLVNWQCGTNFGYLAAKPHSASLLDALAPWPWYIAELEALSLVSFLIYAAPFFCAARKSAIGAGSSSSGSAPG